MVRKTPKNLVAGIISVIWARHHKSAKMSFFAQAFGIFPQSARNIPYNYSGLTSTATGLLSAAFANTSSRTPSFSLDEDGAGRSLLFSGLDTLLGFHSLFLLV